MISKPFGEKPNKASFWLPFLLAGALAGAGPAMADAAADYEMGVQRYKEGDVVGAMAPLRKASAEGHLKGMVLLAQILDSSEFDDEAVELFRKAAEQGDPDGMLGYGSMLAAGEGVKERNLLEGRRWVLKAAEAGQEQAIGSMAQAYLKGELGFTEADRDTPEALRWVQAAAKVGHLSAIDALADAYRTGGILGVQANAALADEYFNQAAKIRNIDPVKAKKKIKKTAAQAAK